VRDGLARVRYCTALGEPLHDARALIRGDLRLTTSGVRLTIFGVLPERAPLTGRAALDVLYPQRDSKATFRAWSHDAAGLAGTSRANSFIVPLDEQGGLALDLHASGRSFPVELRVGRALGQPKLRCGVYLISPGARACETPIDTLTLVATVDPGSAPPRRHEPWRFVHA
jgi:hypothetical protein